MITTKGTLTIYTNADGVELKGFGKIIFDFEFWLASTLHRQLMRIKNQDLLELCTRLRPCIYIWETKRALDTHIKEHKAATRWGETEVGHRRAHMGTASPNTVEGNQRAGPSDHTAHQRGSTHPPSLISSSSTETRALSFWNAGNQSWTMPWWQAPPMPRHAMPQQETDDGTKTLLSVLRFC